MDQIKEKSAEKKKLKDIKDEPHIEEEKLPFIKPDYHEFDVKNNKIEVVEQGKSR